MKSSFISVFGTVLGGVFSAVNPAGAQGGPPVLYAQPLTNSQIELRWEGFTNCAYQVARSLNLAN